jgi:hypothetical protein
MGQLFLNAHTSDIARDLTLKAIEALKVQYPDTDPGGVGKAIGELYNAILGAISNG